jgi:hypothetical protein
VSYFEKIFFIFFSFAKRCWIKSFVKIWKFTSLKCKNFILFQKFITFDVGYFNAIIATRVLLFVWTILLQFCLHLKVTVSLIMFRFWNIFKEVNNIKKRKGHETRDSLESFFKKHFFFFVFAKELLIKRMPEELQWSQM